MSAQNNKLDVVELLLNATGVDVNKATQEGFTPMYIAAKQQNIEIMMALHRAGADGEGV